MQPMSYSLEEQAFGNFLKFKVIKASAPLWSVKSEVVFVPQLCSIWSPRTNIYLWCQGRMEAHFQHIKVGPSSQATTNLLSNIKAHMAVESPKARPARLASKQAFPSITCDRLAWHILQWAECYEDQWQDSACRICCVCWFCKGNITFAYSSPFFMQMLVAWATLSPSSFLGEILSLGDPKK